MSNENKFGIFVVDDSDLSRKGIVEVLESHGFNVVGQASSAEEALKSPQAFHAKLFLIDVVMPDISGIELAKKLNEVMMGKRIIMMSSLQMENVVIEAISSGAIDFLYKPFEVEDLIKAVEKVDTELKKEG